VHQLPVAQDDSTGGQHAGQLLREWRSRSQGAKDNPWIESLWGRTKTEVGSRIAEASSLPELRDILDERFRYYNQERRHSSIGYLSPCEHLNNVLCTCELEPRITAAS
jgi:transposase InsO family protein